MTLQITKLTTELPKILAGIPKQYNGLLLVSSHFPSSAIKDFHSKIYKHLECNVVGGIVDSINGGAGWSLSLFDKSKSSCFFSEPGFVRRNKSVGRWPSVTSLQKEVGEFKSISLATEGDDGKRVSPILDGQSYTGGIITVSDEEPYDLYKSFNDKYPSTDKIGILAAQTPFITGLHNTLFWEGGFKEKGTVGIMLRDKVSIQCETSQLYPISERLNVTKCQGNIILEVDGKLASSFLVKKVGQDDTSNENHDLFMRVISQENKEAVFKITGGDISKGTLALDTLMDLKEGMTVEFLRLDSNLSSSAPSDNYLTFTTIPKEEDIVAPRPGLGEGTLVGSEQGVVASNPSVLGGFQVCNSPGLNITLNY